jgi:hypothetical protein
MRLIEPRRWLLAGAGLGLLASLGISGCAATPSASPGSSPVTRTVTPAASPARSAASPAPAASTATSATPAAVQNLLVSTSVRSQLAAAYAAYEQIPGIDLAGTVADSIYYAYAPATSKYWAMATFVASATAPLSVTVNFQDGGNIGLFEKTGNDSWRVALGHIPSQCAEARFFPSAVLAAWALPDDAHVYPCS